MYFIDAINSLCPLSEETRLQLEAVTTLCRFPKRYRLVREGEPYYDHVLEGADDMPAHAKCGITGVSLCIPISNHKLDLGTWQGIYLCEFRDYGGERHVTATIIGE